MDTINRFPHLHHHPTQRSHSPEKEICGERSCVFCVPSSHGLYVCVCINTHTTRHTYVGKDEKKLAVSPHTNRNKITYSHSDSHVGLGDSVHGRGEEGGLEGDALGDLGLELDGMSLEVDEPGEDQKVIVGQTTLSDRVHQLLGGETVATVLGSGGFEVLEGQGGIGILGLDSHVLACYGCMYGLDES